MLQIGSYAVYRTLHDRYYSKILGETPEGMRPPTIQEVRCFDRTLHQELLRWLLREVGTLDAGMEYYLGQEELASWRLLDPVVATLPDQGLLSENAKQQRKRKRTTAAQSR